MQNRKIVQFQNNLYSLTQTHNLEMNVSSKMTDVRNCTDVRRGPWTMVEPDISICMMTHLPESGIRVSQAFTLDTKKTCRKLVAINQMLKLI